MYKRCSFIRKVKHFILILSLLLTAIVPGFAPMEVLAEVEPVSAETEYVFYVNGVSGNEWSEGHYVAPCLENGFQYLQAIREVLTCCDNLPDYRVPEMLKFGPYES